MPQKTDVKKLKSVSYAKWGYIFIAPFFIMFIVFQLIPLISTFYSSFFQDFYSGLKHIGPTFVGLDNYAKIFADGQLAQYALNTVIIWIMGFIPQILVAMLLAVFFTSFRLKLKAQPFFKTVIYMPNLIMAAAMASLFWFLCSPNGPVNQALAGMGIETVDFFNFPVPARSIVAFINFLMWFGNTTILLMAGIMGIDQSLFESAQIDGAKTLRVFFKITLPLLMPILVYVLITSMIGGIQMFDVPQVITTGLGNPNNSLMTLIMYLNNNLVSKNVGMGGAISVLIFVVTAILSIFVYRSLMRNYKTQKVKAVKTRISAAKTLRKRAQDEEVQA